MEKARSPREGFFGVTSQAANFWLLAEGPKCREPYRGNLLCPRKCSLSSKKFLSDRCPILGIMDSQKLLNVPLQPRPAASAGGRGSPSPCSTAPTCQEGEDWPNVPLQEKFHRAFLRESQKYF